MQFADHAAHTLCLAFLFSPDLYPIARSGLCMRLSFGMVRWADLMFLRYLRPPVSGPLDPPGFH